MAESYICHGEVVHFSNGFAELLQNVWIEIGRELNVQTGVEELIKEIEQNNSFGQGNRAMDIVDATHPSTTTLPLRWLRTDEWYNFRNMNPAINSVINLDESTYSGGEEGAIHPIAWFHEFDGGRSFYTAMGHTEASYNEPDFRAHLLGGILYCLNR